MAIDLAGSNGAVGFASCRDLGLLADFHSWPFCGKCIGTLPSPRLEHEISYISSILAATVQRVGYLLLVIIVMRRRIANSQLQAWLWILPMWIMFMFVFGILIETRVFGELIPFVVCSKCLVIEETIVARQRQSDSLMMISDRKALREFNNAA